MEITHVFFDLDGTLVDSFPGISFSAGVAAAEVFPGRALPDLLPFIGPPIREIFRRSLSEENAETLARLEESFRKSYDTLGWKKTLAYPGVIETLKHLHASGIVSCVLTNKPRRPTETILSHLGMMALMADVITPDTRTPRFASKTEAALDARARLRVAPGAALIVGDSLDDAAAAEACGFAFAAVSFGYGTADRQTEHPVGYRLDRFADLLTVDLLADTPQRNGLR